MENIVKKTKNSCITELKIMQKKNKQTIERLGKF